MSANVLITGGSGFIGKHLCLHLLANGFKVYVLSRDPEAARRQSPAAEIHYVEKLQELAQISWQAVVNLAGQALDAKRWNPEVKKTLVESRVSTTENLLTWMGSLQHKPKVLISASAIGWYGHRGDEELDESSGGGEGFAHDLCERWEQTAMAAASFSRVCRLRIGIVLGSDGGPLAKMRLPALLGLNGPFGHGRQWWSWIHVDDLVRLIHFAIAYEAVEGAINGTAPAPVRQKDFARALGQQLRRPSFAPMPAFLARMLLGEFADEILLEGQRVLPRKALAAGFQFQFENLPTAMEALL